MHVSRVDRGLWGWLCRPSAQPGQCARLRVPTIQLVTLQVAHMVQAAGHGAALSTLARSKQEEQAAPRPCSFLFKFAAT